MTAGAHILAGAMTAALCLKFCYSTKRVFLIIFFAAILSHLALDAVPHFNPPFHFPPTFSDLAVNSADVVLAVWLVYSILEMRAMRRTIRKAGIWLGAIAAILPDVEQIIKTSVFGPEPLWWFESIHEDIQWHLQDLSPGSMAWIAVDIGLYIIALIWWKNLKKNKLIIAYQPEFSMGRQ